MNMERDNKSKNVVNHFEKDSNCQVFNGDIRDCVFAMPGSQVTQQVAPKSPIDNEMKRQEQPTDNNLKREEIPTFLIHPAVERTQEQKIHDEIKRLVARHGIQEICKYLSKLSDEDRVLLPQNAEKAYNELVRLGMPDGEGFNLKTFRKYYHR